MQKSTDYGVVTIRSSSSLVPDDEDKDKLPEREDKPDEDNPDEDNIPETEDKDTVQINSNVKSTDYGVVTIRSSSSPVPDDEDKDKFPEREDKPVEDKPDEDNIPETEDKILLESAMQNILIMVLLQFDHLLLLYLMMKIKTSYLKVKTNQMKINQMKTKYLKLKTNILLESAI